MCGSASGMVRSDQRPSSPISAMASLEGGSAAISASYPRPETPCSRGCAAETSFHSRSTKISGGDSSECPGFHHPIGESSCVLGRLRRDCSRSFGRFSEASTFPGGNSPCLGSHQVVRGVCASCSEASFASRGGGDRSCGASRAHEGGVRRGPTQIGKICKPRRRTHLHQFFR